MKTLYKEIDKWVRCNKKMVLKSSSFKRYISVTKLIGKYPVGDVMVSELTTSALQDYINRLVEDGYARETIHKQCKVLTEFLVYAMNEGELTRPVYAQLKSPKECIVKHKKRDIISYSAVEQDRLKRVLWRGDNPSFYAARLMLETGMRCGEVLALTWSDIDFNRRAVSINKTTIYSENKLSENYVQNEPKTISSKRTIPLSRDAMRAINALRVNNDELSDYLFHDKDGVCFTYGDLRWWIRKACEEAGVPYYGQHVFRHTFATNCYYKGCDVKLLSRFLGHANTAITYNTYIHLYGDALEDMRTIID